MHCPSCGSSDIHRSRRRGFKDRMRSWLGLWPYTCHGCETRFVNGVRYGPRVMATHQPQDPRPPQSAVRRDAAEPVAQIVVRAESHAKLDEILLSLNRAVSAYGAKPIVVNPEPDYSKSGASNYKR